MRKRLLTPWNHKRHPIAYPSPHGQAMGCLLGWHRGKLAQNIESALYSDSVQIKYNTNAMLENNWACKILHISEAKMKGTATHWNLNKSMAQCKTAVSPGHWQWRYCSLALSQPNVAKCGRWCLQAYYLEIVCFLYFDSYFTEVCSQGSNWPELVHAMAWYWTGDKPLPEPMMAQFYYVICHCWASMS